MSSVIALFGAVALLFAASGILLWRRAHLQVARVQTERFVERRVAAIGQDVRAPAAGGMSRATQAAVQGAAMARTGAAPGIGRQAAQSGAGANGATAAASTHAGTGVSRWLAELATAFQHAMSRAGIADARRPAFLAAFATFAVCLWAALAGGALAATVALLAALAVIAFLLSWRTQRRRMRLVRQLPSFLDGMVRLIVLGNSVPAAFQAALQTSEAPLRECLDHVSRMLRTGVEIDRALHQVAQVYHARELELVGAVLRLSVRYGGRADVMLERMATFMRDLEQAQRELVAMSAETRLSAWVLALLPLGIVGFLVVTNPLYFGSIWNDESGRRLLYAAFGLQMVGVFLLYRLTRPRGGL